MNKKLLLLFFFCFFLIINSSFLLAKNATLLWNYEQIKEIKDNPSFAGIVIDCIATADSYLQMEPITVMDKTWSFNDDFHYYATMAGYWWPEEKNGKVVYVRHDGKSYPGANDLDFRKIKYMADRLQYFSLAYFFTGKSRYLRAMKKQLDVWFLSPKTYMYPNFNYAQVIPGKKEIKGRGVGLIEAHPFNTIMESVRLIETKNSIGKKRKRGLVKWFSDFADWMVESEQGIVDRKANSNQSISYDITLANIYEFIDREDLARKIIKEFPEKRINVQIQPDGKLPSELNRTNAFTYSTASLGFFSQFCILAKSLGEDLYSHNKDRFDVALRFLIGYMDRHEEFPYQQINGWESATKNLNAVLVGFKRINPNIEKELQYSLDSKDVYSLENLLIE